LAGLLRRLVPQGDRLRVLVVDDSVVIRRLVREALSADPSIEVVGTAADGSIALQSIPQLNPDVVTLDIEMPNLDGLATLKEIRRTYPHVRVVMLSGMTQRGAAATFDALALGADDYVTKAHDKGSLDQTLTELRAELLPKILQFHNHDNRPGWRPSADPDTAPKRAGPLAKRARRAVAIGVSTGGPQALSAIIPQFPGDLSLPVFVVQHMPPMFTRLLAERLQTQTRLRVDEATEGAVVGPAQVFLAPGDYHMKVRRRDQGEVIALDQGPLENSCRPAADVLFRSVAEEYGGEVVTVVLTGMGHDGLRGVETLKAKGAYVIAQDEASSVVWGMPGAVAGAGLADAVVSLDNVVPEIMRQL